MQSTNVIQLPQEEWKTKNDDNYSEDYSKNTKIHPTSGGTPESETSQAHSAFPQTSNIHPPQLLRRGEQIHKPRTLYKPTWKL